MNDGLRATVVVPTRNRGSALFDTLDTIRNQGLSPEQYEVIVVDSSDDDSWDLLQDYLESNGSAPRIHALREERVGVHYARHLGAHAGRAPIFVQIEDDALAEHDWLAELIRPIEEDPGVACTGGRVELRLETTLPWWWRPYVNYLTRFSCGDRVLRVPSITACSMAVRMSALQAAGGFNPCIMGREVIGNGEVGLCEKIRRRDLGEIMYVPAALVWHCVPAARLERGFLRRRIENEGATLVQTLWQRKQFSPIQSLGVGVKYAVFSVWAWIASWFYRLSSEERGELFFLKYLLRRRQAQWLFRLANDREAIEWFSREEWMNNDTPKPPRGVSVQ